MPVVRCAKIVPLLVAAGGMLSTAPAVEPQRFDVSRPVMATVFRVSLFAENEAKAKAAADEALAKVESLARAFSDYDPDSELMRLCQQAPAAMKVSDDLAGILKSSLATAEQTGGAFDICIGRMTQLWRRSRRQKELPSTRRLAEARELSGWRLVHLDAAAKTAAISKPGALLDLGGIAKGYAADQALAVIRERHGIRSAVVVAGGDMAIGDPPPGEKGWEVKLRTFEKDEQEAQMPVLRLSRCGVSTSGDLHQFIEIGGVRYSHIVDPHTGLGLARRIACTVIAPDAATSDALATAMCVLGTADGRRVIGNQPQFHARWAELSDDSQPVITATAGFPKAEPRPGE